MNQKNFEYLRDQVKYTGFGDGLENDLNENLGKQLLDFKLNHKAEYGSDKTTSELHFSKSKQSDMYFFNSYTVSLQKPDSPDPLEQTFYINKSNNITLKEAYNLMSGRAVNKDLTNKDGQIYNAWIQMDFNQADKNGNYKLKQFHQNYGYDLEQVLAKHPIKELGQDEYKSNLLDSLKKGNRQSATLIQDGIESKIFIEANPRFKTVNMYDINMQRMGARQSKTEKQSEGEHKAVKQDSKKEGQNAGDDGPGLPQTAKKKKKSMSVG